MFRLINESPNAVIRLSEVVVATVGAIFGYCDYFHVHLSYVSVEVACCQLLTLFANFLITNLFPFISTMIQLLSIC